ncbi:MAG: sel1 repeat family protein [Mesorhizobium sp.]|nr:sel1 repeat family protein [Mesorhizobium sp.]
MARYEMLDAGIGNTAQADILFQLGMMYATGRDCEIDLVAAHKWFNIAAIKGSDRAAELRQELASSMAKHDIAKALREARQWMAVH